MNKIFTYLCLLSSSTALLAETTPAVAQPNVSPATETAENKPAEENSDGTTAKHIPEIPSRLLDDSHMQEELGVNEFTAPSIKKIFETLEGLPTIPEETAIRVRPEKLPIDRCSLALEMGFLMGDGFIVVQCGKMNDVRPISLDLSRYAKAMGAGERVNRHSASLLKNAEDGDLTSFKENLALTQTDVQKELESLGDPDMAHLIALGGWIRALDASTAALSKKFDTEQALIVFQPDIPEYFAEVIEGVDPEMRQRRDINNIAKLLQGLVKEMTLIQGSKPTEASISRLRKTADDLIAASIGPVKGK